LGDIDQINVTAGNLLAPVNRPKLDPVTKMRKPGWKNSKSGCFVPPVTFNCGN
jgi:hypothetical protein